MEFILSMVSIALKLLSIGFGIWLFRWIAFGKGKETLKYLAQTIGLSIQTGCVILRDKLAAKLDERKLLSEDKDDPTKVDAHVI